MPGRLTLISRMGADRVRELLPPLLRAVREAGHPVVWACDPMHANMFTTEDGRKTRRFDAIVDEIEGFFAACQRGGRLAGRRAPRVHRATTSPSASAARTTVLEEHLDLALHDALRPAAERAAVARPRVPRRRADARAWHPRPSDARQAARHRRHRPDRRLRRARREAGRRASHVAGFDPDPARRSSRRRAGRGRRAGAVRWTTRSRAPTSPSSPRRWRSSPRRSQRCSRRRRRRARSPTSARRRPPCAPRPAGVAALRRRPSGLRLGGARRRRTRARTCSTARPGS